MHAFAGLHALLQEQICCTRAVCSRLQALVCRRVAIRQVVQIGRAFHRHDLGAAGAVIGLDLHKRLFLNAILFVFAPNATQQRLHMVAQLLHTLRALHIHRFAGAEQRGNQPMVNTQHLAKALGHLFIAGQMAASAAHVPARMHRRQYVLLVQFFQNTGRSCTQIVIDQHRTRVKVLQPNAPLGTNHRLQQHAVAQGIALLQRDAGRLLDFVADGAHAHIQPRHPKNANQLRQIVQIGRVVLCAVFRYQQQIARFGAGFFNHGLRRLHGQRQGGFAQMVPASGIQIRFDRRELEACIAHIHRAIKRRHMLHPLQPKPTFRCRHRVDDALLQFIDRATQGGNEVWNHRASIR